MTQVPLSITDSHQRALAFHRITEGLADYAQAINHSGDVHEALTCHSELQVLREAVERIQGAAIDKADAILKEK